jgi:hypothetical protein
MRCQAARWHMEHQLEIISNCYGAHCCTAALLLLYCCFTAAYNCFTAAYNCFPAALLLLYCCFTAGACERIVRSNVPAVKQCFTADLLVLTAALRLLY